MTVRAPVLGFVWQQFGAYHMDRCEAVGRALGAAAEVVGLEHATTSDTYDWPPSGTGDAFRKRTLFPGGNADRIGQWRLLLALIRATRRDRIDTLFICGYDRPAHFGLALWARITGRRAVLMNESKFDDKLRSASFEFFKQLFLLPYHATLTPGWRAAGYVQFLGLRKRPVAEGYSVVSLDRMRRLAAGAKIPAWEERAFVIVARLVPKKNHDLALRAYRRYRDIVGNAARPLRICGDGPLMETLRTQARTLGIEAHVIFLGSIGQTRVAEELAVAVALLLPSVEEQWGLVVNEALAFGLPVIVSNNVGAGDRLVTSLRTGFVLDGTDETAWAEAMRLLGHDRETWERLHEGSLARAPLADTGAFVAGCVALAGIDVPAPHP